MKSFKEVEGKAREAAIVYVIIAVVSLLVGFSILEDWLESTHEIVAFLVMVVCLWCPLLLLKFVNKKKSK